MADSDTLEKTIEKVWDTIPFVWKQVRDNIHANAVQDFDITFIQFRMLHQIRRGARTVGDLAAKHQISRPAISQAVDLLVKKGLITRRQDDQDRRYVQLEITDKGNQVLNTLIEKSHAWMNKKMASLTPDELETINHAMTILCQSFHLPRE